MAEQDYVRLAAACHCGQPVKLWSGRGRKPTLCDAHSIADEAVRQWRGCEHEKPRFTTGRERKFCFECVPKPASKPRKQRSPQEARYERTCCAPDCGAAFRSKLPRAKFCSDRYRNRISNRAGQERRRDNSPRACPHCGTVYVPAYGSRRDVYCTADCQKEASRKVRSGSTHRRRAAKFGGRYEPVNKREVFERDGWRCYLCGVETPKALSGSKEPNAPELEHVVPLSAGGDHVYSNVRCACRRCNRAKGARLLPETAQNALGRAGVGRGHHPTSAGAIASHAGGQGHARGAGGMG